METRLWIDGTPAEADPVARLAMVNYGHFTAMQVRDRRVRGVDAHLDRVDGAHRELFGHGLDRGWVRDQWSRAVAAQPDASLRATFYDDAAEETHVAIVVRAPVRPATDSQTLQSVRYVRPVAHLKHVGTFGQIYHGEAAERAGFDDALLVDDQRRITETTTANIGFLREGALIWPLGPVLNGIGQQLLTTAALEAGRRVDRVPIWLDQLDTFDEAFTVNSVGVASVRQIDTHRFDRSDGGVQAIVDLHDRLRWDELAG